ncbi:hypothetical protein [Biformimicrobium ophioploci]|uniref:Uncharacterized protein n=1 Tax=Biformimicrobium ophioploci TaxID=3036711 RepID=A0ABQ6LVA8_9GAMM|nr:hypothetical protein [Microbulbifer sp. NKW57]GMG86034.1 hypothetical protein MNKW57_03550 [Microbulbifer sp. NKW57]
MAFESKVKTKIGSTVIGVALGCLLAPGVATADRLTSLKQQVIVDPYYYEGRRADRRRGRVYIIRDNRRRPGYYAPYYGAYGNTPAFRGVLYALPSNAMRVRVDGRVYYVVNGIYYQWDSSVQGYRVARP